MHSSYTKYVMSFAVSIRKISNEFCRKLIKEQFWYLVVITIYLLKASKKLKAMFNALVKLNIWVIYLTVLENYMQQWYKPNKPDVNWILLTHRLLW